MIVNVTIQTVDGDCPWNVIVDLSKLEKIDDEDARLYVKNIKEEYDVHMGNKERTTYSRNPNDWRILEQVKVNPPVMVDFTVVIFNGN